MTDQIEDLNETEVEHIENHNPEDERAFINSLGDDDTDFDPTEPQKVADKHALILERGEATMLTALGVAEGMVKGFVHPEFAFDPNQAEDVAKKTAPLFVKYGGDLPPWLSEYKEELGLLVALGGLGFVSYGQIKHLKAEDLRKELEAKKKAEEEAVTNATYQPE